MSQSYVNLLYHVVFSTKDREPLIVEAVQPRLYEYIGGIVRKHGGVPLAVNGTEDHLHLFAKLRQDVALSDLIRDLKASSSGWMHRVFPALKAFTWQHGYGAFTVSASQAGAVRRYVERQKVKHRGQGFEEEFVRFLRANGVEFDERYLWQ
ncbi:MAG TPA: IS200/IS605 family transposase [Pyrinomonadaceae bacterium]|nr:IS200/IS605 family transposase [Pyrinomonadaceae bacterium]